MKIETTIHFRKRGKGKRKEAVIGPVTAERPKGRIPRISRLMALAIWFDELLRSGQVESYAELARIGQVTPARVTHVMNLLLLAPEIQERLLFLPRVEDGKDEVYLKDLQRVVREWDWGRQTNLQSIAIFSDVRCRAN